MPENRWIHKAHKFIAKQLHKPAGWFGAYTQGQVSKNSYAFSIESELEDVEQELNDRGFYRNPTAFLTYRKVDHFKEVDKPRKNYTEGSWVNYLDGLLSEYQLHITLYSAYDDGYVDIYAHHETSWLRHPYKHLVDNDYSAEMGIEILKNMFNDYPKLNYRSEQQRGWV